MKDEFLSKSGERIARPTTCPCFCGRKSLLAIEPICWFCKFAKFDLKDDKLPEWGVCCYPKEQEKRGIQK
jgi:hypothetical protein